MFRRADKPQGAPSATTDTVREPGPSVVPPAPAGSTDSGGQTVTTTSFSTPSSAPAPAKSAEKLSVISRGLKVVGNVISEDDIQVDGSVEGDIKGTSVSISANAQVNGSLSAQTVTVDGIVNGEITADRVRISSAGRVKGDIHYRTLAVEEGGILDGQCRPSSGVAKPGEAPKPSLATSKPEPAKADVSGSGSAPKSVGSGSG